MCAHRVEVQKREVTAICFHGFEALPRDEEITSPEFHCLGHNWSLEIFINSDDDEDGVNVNVWLNHKSDDSIDIECDFTVRDSARKEVAHWTETACFDDVDYVGKRDFSERSKLIHALVDGALTIEVGIRKKAAPGNIDRTPVFVPENPLRKNILNKFLVEESADVIFEVDRVDERAEGEHKRAKTFPAVFHAHRSVLRHGAPTLAELCTPREGEGESVTVQITGVRAEAFRLLLYYAYGGEIAADELTAHARDLVDAADKYDLASLKLEAEASCVKSTTFTTDNLLDNLLYAHCKNCALLQEAVMDFVVQNVDLVVDKVSFNDVPGSIMNDLLVAMARGKKERSANKADGYSGMRVGTLRKMLHEKGLEVDGSRDAMIALLKGHP